MANNPYVNKVEFGNQAVMDISDTTATADDVLAGKKFYSASGAPATGTLVPGTITEVQANGTSVATSGIANIPAASTSGYGVTKLNNTTSSTSTSEAATAAVAKQLNDKLTPSAATSVTSNGITLEYRQIGKIVVFEAVGIPTDASTVASFEVPSAAIGCHIVSGQWGDVNNMMATWIDSSSSTIRMRYYNINTVRVSGVYLSL